VTIEESGRPGPIVQTAQGLVRGRNRAGWLEFRGIPYAEAPQGPLRFAPPRRQPRWDDTGVLDATFFGDAAPQQPPEPPLGTLLGTRASSEDCLSLNVWTPAADRDARRPVMVWIHGGGYADESGSDDPYHGHTFARDGIVLVTINYRLGVLGYLHVAEHFDLGAGSGNFGALDQIAALEWVAENIAAFGGDPSNVTIFGESAGGWAVATLLASPRASGLFRRAICQSGAGDHVLAPEEAQRVTDRYLALLGVKPGDLDHLRSVDTRTIIAAQAALYGEALAGGDATDRLLGDRAGLLLCLMPVTTGEVVSAPPVDLIRSGNGHDIDLIVGSNSTEYGLYRLFPGGVFSAARMLELSRSALRASGCRVEQVEAAYRAEHGDDDFAVGEAMETDRFFRLPAIELAQAHAGGSGRTFLYELAWSGSELGACHLLDVPFVFDRLDTPLARRLAGDRPNPDVATVMHSSWVAFATWGDPDPSRQRGWSAVQPGKPGSFVINGSCHMDTERDGRLLSLWSQA
jgi:para-nitrobenzyl esterase